MRLFSSTPSTTPQRASRRLSVRQRGVERNPNSVHDTSWGTREFALYDLDRNALTFYRDLTSAEKERRMAESSAQPQEASEQGRLMYKARSWRLLNLSTLSCLRLLALLDRVVTQKGMNAAYPIDHLSYAQVHN